MKRYRNSYLCMLLTVVLFAGAVFAQEGDAERAGGDPVVGWASYVSSSLDGAPTASGEIYDEEELTAAHRTYPFGTKLHVTNLDNGEKTVVRVNDRGPYRPNRILDVSLAAARELGFVEQGLTRVRIEVVE